MAEKVVSVFRNEKKYFIPWESAFLIREKLDQVLLRDKYSETSGYSVRSLYFDSVNHIDFKTKLAGVEHRKKIRLRIYVSDAKRCKLEVKKKDGDLQQKTSLWMKKEDAYELMHMNYSVLTKYFEESPEAVSAYMTMVNGCYRPVVLVEYDRIAYTYPLYNTRITIDMNLRSSESNLDLFDREPAYTIIMNDPVILEVKYNQKLVRFLSKLLKPFCLTQCSASKYCMGRKVFYDFEF